MEGLRWRDLGRPPRVEGPGKTLQTTDHVRNSSQAERVRSTGRNESPHRMLP